MRFLIFPLAAILALAAQAYEDDYHPDSWNLGTPDNVVKTVIVVDPYGDCGCP